MRTHLWLRSPRAVAVGVARRVRRRRWRGSGAEVASLGTDADATTDDTTDGTDCRRAPTDPEEAMLEFTECMRDHGVDMPDPQTPTATGRTAAMIAVEGDPTTPSSRRPRRPASRSWTSAMGEIEIDPERQAEMKEQLLAFSAVHARPRHRHARPGVRRQRRA